MDIEFQRMKERLETIHLILDDMQVCIGQFITTSFLKMKYFSIFALSLYDEMGGLYFFFIVEIVYIITRENKTLNTKTLNQKCHRLTITIYSYV